MASVPAEFLIWGGGGHGKVVADLVRALGHSVTGFVDRDPAKAGCIVDPGGGRVVLIEEDFLAELRAGRSLPVRADAVALGLGNNAARQCCLDLLGDLAAPPLVHPAAVVSPSASLGRGTVVLARAVVNPAAIVGSGVIINTGAIVEHDCALDDAVHVSPGAVLAGGVRVGARSWIGAGATVIQGVTIGEDVIVGAGAVVIRDVPSGVVVAGVPARTVRTRSNESR